MGDPGLGDTGRLGDPGGEDGDSAAAGLEVVGEVEAFGGADAGGGAGSGEAVLGAGGVEVVSAAVSAIGLLIENLFSA